MFQSLAKARPRRLTSADLFAVTSNQMVIRRQGGIAHRRIGGRKGRKSRHDSSYRQAQPARRGRGPDVARGARRPRRLGAGLPHPPDLVGQCEPQRADREGHRTLHDGEPWHRRRGRERRLGRLLDPARHPDRRRQRAGRHADGLPLHLRVRAPRRAAAARRRDGDRRARRLGLLRGRPRRRQGRRQDLRHQPRRQLEHDDRQQGGLRGGRASRCPSGA